MKRDSLTGSRSLSGLAAFIAALSLSPFSAALAQDAPQRGGTVIMVLGADPPTLNPVVSTGIPDGSIGCMVYQGLTRVDGKREVAPQLAKSWTVSPDGKSYTFNLVTANWNDGKPFTSADVKYSLLEANAKISPPFAAAGKMIDSIDTPSPDKAVVNLKQPFGPLLISLACGWGGAILPKHVFEGSNIPQNPASTTNPVGTGGFTLKEWKRGDNIRMVRNPNYWEPGKPYLDEVVARIIPQPAARTQALQAGEVDFLFYYYLPNSDHPAIEANQKLKLEQTSMPPSLDYMAFNVKRKPLDDKKVRQALFVATDREYLIKNGWLGKGKAGSMPLSSEIKWAAASPEIDFNKIYAFDPARANTKLDEAGLKRGSDGTRFKAKLVYATDESDNQLVSAALKSMWRNVGVDLEIEANDRTTHMKRVFQDHDFDVTINGYGTFNEPAVGLARIFISSAIGSLYANSSNYSNPEVDDLFTRAAGALTQADRGALYRQVQAILAVDMPTVPLREKALFNASTKKLNGFAADTDQYRNWTDAWLSK